jgi:MFS-type transporter involved in bile tolerance (Atg22 family)
VQFNDYVTINHPEGYVPETVKLYRLLRGITMLVVILVCAALILGFFFGGGRALIRVMRGKSVSAVTEEEFISLHLGS